MKNKTFKSWEELELYCFPERVKKRKLTKIKSNPKALGAYLGHKAVNKALGIKDDQLLDKILEEYKNELQPRL